MSLLVNDIALNKFLQTSFSNFEIEEGKDNKETKTFLLSFKTKQKLIGVKIPIFDLFEDNAKNNTIKLLNKSYLKSYFNFLKLAKKKSHYNEFIQYVIHMSILKNNTMIHVTSVKGQLKFFCSASFSLKLSGKQKTMQPKVLIALIKHLLNTAYFLKSNNYYRGNEENLLIALHSKHINRSLLKLIIARLKKKLNIKTINFSNFYPHNGCRNKKIKRLKRRKKNRKTKKPFVYTDSNKKLWRSFIQPKFTLKNTI